MFIQIFVVCSQKTHIFCNRVHIGLQGHPRSLIIATVRRAYATSYSTFVLSCTVSEIWRLIGWKLWNFPTLLSFNALARGEPFRISGWTFCRQDYAVGEYFVNLACVVLTQCQRVTERDGRTDRQSDRQTDNSTVANTGLWIASYADAL